MKKTMKSILSGVVFLLGLLALLAGLSRLLEYKGSREKITPFMQKADQVDVLFFGDSHAYSGIYPMELWEDYGIASYNLANYNLTIPASYWVMRNALLVCNPKVVVLDVNQIWEQAKLGNSSSDLHTGLDGFPLNRTKLEAIYDLTDDPLMTDKTGQRYMDLRAEFIVPFIKYHDRWSDLSARDISPNYERELGGERNIAVAEPDTYEISYSVADEQGYGFVYLRRFIEYCSDRGIRVLLTDLPYPCKNNNDEQLYTNAVTYMADEYGIEYIDFVFMDQVVDYSTDCYDPGSHLNPSGAWKVTDFLGCYLTETYDLPNHRGEEAYASWDTGYAAYRSEKLKSICEETEADNFLMLLADPSFSTVLLVPEGSKVGADQRKMQLLQNAGRRHLMPEDADEAVWSDSLMPLEQLPDSGEEAYMAIIDRAGASIGECVGEGSLSTSFGSVSLDKETGDAAVTGTDGSFNLNVPSGTDVYAAVLDKQTGEVLYERAIKL